jgi:hypothetical protein
MADIAEERIRVSLAAHEKKNGGPLPPQKTQSQKRPPNEGIVRKYGIADIENGGSKNLSLARSLDRSLARSLARSLDRSLDPSLDSVIGPAIGPVIHCHRTRVWQMKNALHD